ncbi:uncharacterized protein LOC130778264 [Actinidia eriantha]|uniref:uncharacterized protein LOC130778264 n=1 Tax=Actinidia eriantha TaxID=165200 RepID=UPI002587B429|nr:uncharacterized protein LOC130778264 [Actinidia eriantha]
MPDLTWEEDFEFWGEQRTSVYDNYGCSSYGDDVECEAMPLNHHYSYPSPNSRLQAIIDGRRKLMEMIQDMPESSYELSLKDIVDEQNNLQADMKDIVIDERSLSMESEGKTKLQKTKNCKRGRIFRSESMDSGAFLLKMFFPISLGPKRKPEAGNHSKLSRKLSLEGSEKVHKQWWKMRFLSIGESRNSASSSSSGSTSSTRSRHGDINMTPSCWSFNKKNRSGR